MPKPDPPSDTPVTEALTTLLRKGLPAVPGRATEPLLTLRSVLVRATDPTDEAARVTALNSVLRTLLGRFDDARYADSARALFGLPPGAPGTTLTHRREAAAKAAGQDVDHFRKRVEPKLIDRLAWMLRQDSEQFRVLPAAAPRLVPVRDRIPLPADVFAWELTEHEEQLSRVWAAIYALRAELLALDRMTAMAQDRADISRQAASAAWRYGLLLAEAARYRDAYPPGSFGALADTSPEDLSALAGWVPPLGSETVDALTRAGADHPDRTTFLEAVDSTDLTTWFRLWQDQATTTEEDR
ncbi:hypothetical protein SUDANB121_04449 [Nocardiopsis dassonvillei]|uniref:hypothetical protein n=1 Tax=Nocardiopsis dassonvillei TaxID=2014 RepID=UPI003F57C418